MARTRSAAYEDKQQSILDGAAALFAQHGFPKTTIELLARSLNASKAWIYHYYNSKEAVLYAVLKNHVVRLLEVAREASAGDDPAQVRLRRLVQAMLDVYVGSQAKHVVLMNELQFLPPDQMAELKELQNELVDMFQRLILEIRPDLVAAQDLRRPVTMSLMGMINWTYTWFRPDGPMSSVAFADLATDLFLGGIEKVQTDEGDAT